MRSRLAVAVAILMLLAAGVAADTQYWLDGVPDYRWYHGCSPTSGGHLVGYWSHQSGYEGFYPGGAPLYIGSGGHAFNSVIASEDHLNSTYHHNECVHGSGPDCVACFMHTDLGGGSYDWNVATGMRRYAAYDVDKTAYDFGGMLAYTAYPAWPDWANAASFTFDDLCREIDTGRPLLLNLSLVPNAGHTVVAYGYWLEADGTAWFAVRDTWQDGNSSGVYGVPARLDGGHEWWRWDLCPEGKSWGQAYFVNSAVLFGPTPGGALRDSDSYGRNLTEPTRVGTTRRTIYGALAAGEAHFFEVYLNSGDRLWAMTQSDHGFDQAIDTYLRLYDPLDNLLVYSDNNFYGTLTNTSYVLWEAAQAGWWRLAVSGAEPEVVGSYVLEYRTQVIPEPGTLLLVAGGLALVALRRRRVGRRSPVPTTDSHAPNAVRRAGPAAATDLEVYAREPS